LCWALSGVYVHCARQVRVLRTDSPDGDTFAMDADCRKLVASNLPSDMRTAEDVTLFFESKTYCPAGGEVTHVDMNAEDHSAVVTFKIKSGRPNYCINTIL